jgi:hypothetical protein
MKVKVKKLVEIEFQTLVVKAKVRYWEDSEINGENDTENGDNIPCKKGRVWSPEIDIETGMITNWKKGKTAEIHYKVCDCCGYELKDEKGNVVHQEEDGYVPRTLSPKENGYGDYIMMDVDSDGKIDKWKFNVSDFFEDED